TAEALTATQRRSPDRGGKVGSLLVRQSPLKILLACAAVLGALFGARAPEPAPLLLRQPLRIAEGGPPVDVEGGRHRRPSLKIAGRQRVRLHAAVPEAASLRFALSVDPQGATGRLTARAGGRTLLDEDLAALRGWSERRLDLTPWSGQALDLDMTTDGG